MYSPCIGWEDLGYLHNVGPCPNPCLGEGDPRCRGGRSPHWPQYRGGWQLTQHCTHTALLYTTSVVTYHHASLNSFIVFQLISTDHDKAKLQYRPTRSIAYLCHFFVTKIAAVMTTHIARVYSIFIWIPIISDLPKCKQEVSKLSK